MRSLGAALARGYVKIRLLVILAWVGGTIWAAVALPPLVANGGRAGWALVQKGSPALAAQRISAQRFGFPLISQTVVVVRNPHGLPRQRQAEMVQLADRLSQGHVAGFGQIAGALPVLNTSGTAPLSRERGTAALLYLYFRPTVSADNQTQVAQRLVSQVIGHRAGEFEGVTSVAPARVARANTINSSLKWVELAMIALVLLVVAIHFRAVGAPLLTIVTVGIAYLLADRVVARFGQMSNTGAPAELQPLLVALVFGVVTDYSIFYMSRFRALLCEGHDSGSAATRTLREIAPIVAVAGITVAVGTAALLVAHLKFLRAFGPLLAVAVVVAMIVATTFVPAVLAVAGSRTFWPRRMAPPEMDPVRAQPERPSWRARFVRLVVRHPLPAALLACALVVGVASGLSRAALGNDLVLGLPAQSNVHQAYEQAQAAFAPGVLEPSVVVVTGSGVGYDRAALARFQQLLVRQPDVDAVVGPAQQPLARTRGLTVANGGDAARYAVFLKSPPLGSRAISAVRALDGRLPTLKAKAGLSGTHIFVGGDTALSAETVTATLSDLARVTPAVLGAIFLVMAIFLRSLAAPACLVLTSALAAVASLGLTVYVMQMWFGFGQLTYYVVFVVAVLLVSLGSDYNVYLVGRIWQEGHKRPFRDAVAVGGARAARPIRVAGFVLAMSFALLAIVPVRAFRELAFAMAVGLLIDAFVVRTILVPALLALLGRRSVWPRRRLRDVDPAPADVPVELVSRPSGDGDHRPRPAVRGRTG